MQRACRKPRDQGVRLLGGCTGIFQDSGSRLRTGQPLQRPETACTAPKAESSGQALCEAGSEAEEGVEPQDREDKIQE